MSFQFNQQQLQFLYSPQGQHWLTEANKLPLSINSRMADVQRLRKNLTNQQTTAVIEQVLLRRKGANKFSLAHKMFFMRDALEQATHSEVAKHRAKRFKGLAPVADLGCSIGGDSLELAKVVDTVWGFDLDATRLLFAQHNCNVYNVNHKMQWVQANVLNLPTCNPKFKAIFADPARRSHTGKRTFNPQHYKPPLNQLIATYADYPLAIKTAPGLPFSEVPANSEVEVISLAGEAKEMVLWFNKLVTPGVQRRATILPHGASITNKAPNICPIKKLEAYLYEPDPAVIRAGLVKQVGAKLNLHLLDKHIAYLSGNTHIESPYVKGYKIKTLLPLKIKEINYYLKTNHISKLNVKQRGTGLKIESFVKQLKPAKTGNICTLVLARLKDKHIAIICNRL